MSNCVTATMKRVLHISAILALFTAFALAGESPLFKFGYQPNGVNENNEVLDGIEHPSDVGTQKGASLSVQHFLFDKQNEKTISEENTGRVAGTAGSHAAASTPCLSGHQGVPGTIWHDGCTVAARDGGPLRRPLQQAARPGMAATRCHHHQQLGYGYLCLTTQGAQESRQAEKPSTPKVLPETGGPAGILPHDSNASQSVRCCGHDRCIEFDEYAGLPVHGCQKNGFGEKVSQAVNCSSLPYSEPSCLTIRSFETACFLSAETYCNALQRNCPGGLGFFGLNRVEVAS